MVGSGTRKARATSSVDRPPSSRRVSATCASVESAGWQQVKTRRSRSSCTGPTSSGVPGSSLPGESIATSPSSSRPRDSRRRRSMARLRAVVMIQPPGLGGGPSPGHLLKATANASCTASSATSMSPKTRIRAATDRPDSSRKIWPMAASSTFGASSPSRTQSGLPVRERADLDRRLDDLGDLRRPGERGIEVLGLDDVEAAEVLLRLGEGAIGSQHVAVGRAHDGGRLGLVKAAGEDPGAGRLHLLLDEQDLLVGLLHLLIGHGVAGLALDAVDGQQVPGHGGSPSWWRVRPASHPYNERLRPVGTRPQGEHVRAGWGRPRPLVARPRNPWAEAGVARDGDVGDDWRLAEPLRTVASARYRSGADRATDGPKHPPGAAGARRRSEWEPTK